MKLNRRKRRGFEDTSASSDIAFLLIIYFIVIAGFNVNKGFLINLPAKDSTRLILKDDLLRFELDRSGILLFRGEAMDHSTAEREIRNAVASRPNLAVILTVDGSAPWQQVVSFVELAQRLEVESFSFTMKNPEGGST
ncbi:TolR protein [Treponema primitia ZAS-2]|uniref:TolR protein n=1 Tax=Treponema primitia (strain ATCC BAA-887 / DSM 12427 / ZAS-2) TaxID=545694 RepID=F5YJP0_TREPZ|nr:biopolymer transporter ExbD [Treponema primitia]AEF86796.1 TolR protein [Treponema primitia ZAS-2]